MKQRISFFEAPFFVLYLPFLKIKAMRISLFILLFFLLNLTLPAQRRWVQERSNEGGALLLNMTYGLHTPGGDLAKRFGANSSTGGGIEYLTKGNFIIGTYFYFLFGTRVKTDVLAPLKDENGNLYSDAFGISAVQLRERGWKTGVHFGKLFSLGANKRSGIRATVGAGFLQHKIRLQDDPVGGKVSLISGDYAKGYDRLTNGLALTEFISYQLLAKNRRVNFFAGFEFSQGFTQNRRSFHFDTRTSETESRLDLLYGIRFGWTLPFYFGENAEEIQY